jgi:site-specific recombinase XerD
VHRVLAWYRSGQDVQRLLPQLATYLGHIDTAVFLSRVNQPLTRFGIHRVVTQYARLASKALPTLATKRVSPHTIRDTTAVHLLRAGVDINTIRAWLGHVSLETTHIYAEVDMEMKANDRYEFIPIMRHGISRYRWRRVSTHRVLLGQLTMD